MSEKSIGRFRDAVKPFLENWPSVNLRCAAHKAWEGVWRFGSIGAILDTVPESTARQKERTELLRKRKCHPIDSRASFLCSSHTLIVS